MKQESLPGKLQANTKVTVKFIENHPKFSSIEVVQLYES